MGMTNKSMVKWPTFSPFFQIHNNKELTLESDMTCNHCTKFMFELKFWILNFILDSSLHYVRFMGGRHVDCELYNLFLHEFKWRSQMM